MYRQNPVSENEVYFQRLGNPAFTVKKKYGFVLISSHALFYEKIEIYIELDALFWYNSVSLR